VEVIVPNPENTGTGRRAPNLPQGSSGYVTPGGQTLYPGDGSGNAPWSGASGLTQLLNSLGSSGIGSLFGVNGMGNDDGLGSLGPGSQVSGSEIVDFMNTLFQMPIFNQYGGNFGSANNDPGAAIANFAAALHHVGDPTGGRVPGTSTKSPNIPTPADFAAHARAMGAQIMKQWTDYELHGHDPNRGNPTSGGPHPQWWSDPDAGTGDAGKDSGIAAPPSTYVTPGGTQGTSPGGNAGGATNSNTGYAPKSPGPTSTRGLDGWDAGIVIFCTGVGAAYGASKAGADGALGGGVIGALVGIGVIAARHRWFFPSDDGSGGPRSNPAFMPDPETGSGGGPRGFGVMPDPDSGSGGGPRGINFFPDPDSPGGSGPRSNAA